MLDIELIDNDLYRSVYLKKTPYIKNDVWEYIKNNTKLLREAVKVIRNKRNGADTVKGLTICDSMLMDYVNIDPIIYSELIKQIFTNTDIARTVANGNANGGYSFLLLALYNKDLKLSEEQKIFAVKEAMNKISAIKDDEERKKHISAQVHGTGVFDIRYFILRNPNWTKDEKARLVYYFWSSDKEYAEFLRLCEWSIISNYAINNQDPSYLDINSLYSYSYEYLSNVYANHQTASEAYQEIEFCKLLHELRPVSEKKTNKLSRTLSLKKSNE